MKKHLYLIALVLLLSLFTTLSAANAESTVVPEIEQLQKVSSNSSAGFWDFLNKNSGGITALATVLYLGVTGGLLWVSHSQMKCMQKQHGQNIGFQLLEKRTAALTLVVENKFEELELSKVGFLFDREVYDELCALYKDIDIMSRMRVQALSLVKPFEKIKNQELYEWYRFYLQSILSIENQDEIDNLYDISRRIAGILPPEYLEGRLITSLTERVVIHSRDVLKLKPKIASMMEEYINNSIN